MASMLKAYGDRVKVPTRSGSSHGMKVPSMVPTTPAVTAAVANTKPPANRPSR